jgi:hypothetical protein
MRIVQCAAAVALSGLMGCATVDLRDDDVVVKEKAQARWERWSRAIPGPPTST